MQKHVSLQLEDTGWSRYVHQSSRENVPVPTKEGRRLGSHVNLARGGVWAGVSPLWCEAHMGPLSPAAENASTLLVPGVHDPALSWGNIKGDLCLFYYKSMTP